MLKTWTFPFEFKMENKFEILSPMFTSTACGFASISKMEIIQTLYHFYVIMDLIACPQL